MVNPINASPFALSTAPTIADVPSSLTRTTVHVPPSEHASQSNTATSGNRHDEPVHNNPLEKTLEQLNDAMQAWATGMRFDIDEDAQRVVVSIIDSTTGEVLRTVPSEAIVRIAKMIVQLQGGAVNTHA